MYTPVVRTQCQGGRGRPPSNVFLLTGLGLGHQLLCPFLRHLHSFLRRPGSDPFPQLHQVPEFCWLIPGPPSMGADGGFDEGDHGERLRSPHCLPWHCSLPPTPALSCLGLGGELFPLWQGPLRAGRPGPQHRAALSPRFLESHWFVWVTQMNHIVMEIDREPYRDWFSSQVRPPGTLVRVLGCWKHGCLVDPELCWAPGGCLCPAGWPRSKRQRWQGSSGGSSGDPGWVRTPSRQCDMRGGPETSGGAGLVGRRRGSSLPATCPSSPTAGSHLQRGAVLLQRLVQRAS